jgi:hypothetical protein
MWPFLRKRAQKSSCALFKKKGAKILMCPFYEMPFLRKRAQKTKYK